MSGEEEGEILGLLLIPMEGLRKAELVLVCQGSFYPLSCQVEDRLSLDAFGYLGPQIMKLIV